MYSSVLYFSRILSPLLLVITGIFLITWCIRKESSSSFLLTYSEIQEYLHLLASHRGSLCLRDKVAFAVMVFLATISFIPLTPIELAAGFIFHWEALVISLPAKLAGSLVSFAIGRYCWHDILNKRLKGFQLFQGVEAAIESDEWRIVFLLRSLVLPQWIRNYAMSLLNVRFKVFLASCLIVCSFHSFILISIGIQSSRVVEDFTQGSTVGLVCFAVYLVLFITGTLWITAVVKREVEKIKSASIVYTVVAFFLVCMRKCIYWLKVISPVLLIIGCLSLITMEIRKHDSAATSWLPTSAELGDYFKALAENRGNEKDEDKIAFAVLVFLATVACLPITPFELAAGFLFHWEALVIALPAKVLGCIASFIIGRFFWKDLLRSRLASRPVFQGFESAIIRSEWKFMTLIRLMYLPQWVKNYAVSILSVRIRVFIVTTTAVSCMYSLAFTYIGLSSEKMVEELQTGNAISVAVIACAIGFAVFGFLWISSAVRAELANYRLISTEAYVYLVSCSLGIYGRRRVFALCLGD